MIRPSDEEKERAVEYILYKGLKKPKSLWQELYDMYRALGLRYVFYDAASSMGIAVFVMIGFYMISLMSSEQYTNASMFAAAPVFFIFVLILTETAERMSVLYELKMTCKYTIRQIAAFRILCFSLMHRFLHPCKPLSDIRISGIFRPFRYRSVHYSSAHF